MAIWVKSLYFPGFPYLKNDRYISHMSHRGWSIWHIWKYHPEEENPRPAKYRKQVSQCIHKISMCHWILENEHRNPIVKRVHAPAMANGCIKYEQDPLNIVGGGGGGDKYKTRQNTLQPKWAKGEKLEWTKHPLIYAHSFIVLCVY